MSIKKVKTRNATQIIGVLQEIGDDFATRYKRSKSFKDAQLAITAYNSCNAIAKAITTYKKMVRSKSATQFFGR